MFRNKGKLFLVFAMFFVAVTDSYAYTPKYGIVGEGDGPQHVMITNDLFPEANLGPGLHLAFKFDVIAGDELNLGYITMLGGMRDVYFETLHDTLGCCPVVSPSLWTYSDTDYSGAAFAPSFADGWVQYVDVLEPVYSTGVSGYSFRGYLYGDGNYPSVDASVYIIPTDKGGGGTNFVFALDLNTSESRNWIVDVTVGDLSSMVTSPVPEPSTYTMMLMGVLFIWFFYGRRVIKHDPGGV